MEKQLYKQMLQTQTNMWLHYWTWILESWGTPNWVRIPEDVRRGLNLPVGIGMCHGMLITKVSADGANEAAARLNRPRSV